MIKCTTVVAGVGVISLVLVGCSEGSDGVATPIPGESESVSQNSSGISGLPHSGAPAVDNPLPEAVLSDHPCEVLTPQQLREVLGEGTSEGERVDREELGPGCDWFNRETFGGFQLVFDTVSRQGLSAAYMNAKPQSSIFQEIDPVLGFPAVVYKDGENDPRCTAVVGLGDEYSIAVTVSQSAEKKAAGTDSCVPAEQVAELVVGNLKAKAGR